VERFLGRLPVSGHRAYGAALDALAWVADRQTRFLQNGSLHRYLFTVAAAVLVGAAVPLLSDPPAFSPAGNPGIGRPEWLLLALVGAALAAVVAARSRLAAVCGLGVIGAGIALLFLIHGAPDVALTQLLVETLTVIIVSLVLLRLPRLPRGPDPERRRWIDALLAGGLGTLVTILLLAVDSTELDRSLTRFFESNSLASAHVRNIVNVILVDFRSLDTLGEIAVVVIAGLAAVALIRQGRTGP
jgi:multicomponent Na+:H+ antiporter subunit A